MAEATSQLSILVKVKDEASSALRRLSDDVSDLGGSLNFAGMKGGILAGALAAIGGGVAFSNALKAFAESEVQMAHFEAIMKTLPESLQKYRNQILETADAAMKLGFQNEEAAVSIARLFQATGDANFAFQAFQAAMDLARFKGIGLEEATRAIILAFQGNTRMLKELGIEVDEHASKETILAAIMKATAGQAERYSQTLQGLTDTLKIYVGEISKALVQPFAEFIKFIVSNLIAWVENQGGINAVIQQTVTLLTLLSAIIAALVVPALLAKAAALAGISVALAPVAAGIILLIGLAAAIYQAWQTNFLGIRDITETVVNWIIDKLKSLMDFMKKMMDLLGALTRQVKKLFSEGGSMIGGIVGKITPFQAGGIVTRPTLGLLGEAGPEAVVPLNRLAGAGISGGITINLNGDFYTDMETAERWANQIARVIKYQLKL